MDLTEKARYARIAGGCQQQQQEEEEESGGSAEDSVGRGAVVQVIDDVSGESDDVSGGGSGRPARADDDDDAGVAAAQALLRQLGEMEAMVERSELLRGNKAVAELYCVGVDGAFPDAVASAEELGLTADDAMTALSNLEDLLHHVDNAVDLFAMGGAAVLSACAATPEPEVAAAALWALGTMFQNNGAVQEAAAETGILEDVARRVTALSAALLSEVPSGEVPSGELAETRLGSSATGRAAKKAVYALGAMLRSSGPMQKRGIATGLFSTLLPNTLALLSDATGVEPQDAHPQSLAGRIAAILADVMAEATPASAEVAAALPPALAAALAGLAQHP